MQVTIEYTAIEAPGQTALSITCDGRSILSEQIELAEATGRLERALELPEARLWSPDEPNLHLLHVRLGEDDRRERIGIR